jgi:hypothetical protein
MPYIQPSRADVHVNRPLTNVSVAFMQSASAFVADRVFPNVPVSKQSDRYFVYDRGSFNRDEMQRRAPGAESAGGTYSIDNTPTYFADVWAFHRDVPDQVRANADDPLNLDQEAALYLATKAMIRREKAWAAKYFAGALWTTNPTLGAAGYGAKWDTGAASNPIEDIRLAKRTVLQLTGLEPNTLVLARPVYDTLVDHPDIVARVNAGQTPVGPALVNSRTLAAIFELDQVLPMNAVEATSNEGATLAQAFIGGADGALLVYAAPNPGIMTPSGGYTFSWTGYLGASQNGTRVKRFRMEPNASDRVEIEMAFDQKLIAPDLGVFIADTIG